MDKGKKASKFLREAREICSNSCSKVIKAQAATEQFFLAMQERSDKTSEKEDTEINSEIEKMRYTVESFVKATEKLERTWLNGIVKRMEKGRKDNRNNDSGFISVDSTVLQQPGPETIIAQPAVEPNEKTTSDSFAISLSGPSALPLVEGAHGSLGQCSSGVIPSATRNSGEEISLSKDKPRNPLEHEDENYLSNPEKEPTEASDKDTLKTEGSPRRQATTDNKKNDQAKTDTDESASQNSAQDQAQAGIDCTTTDRNASGEVPVRGSTVFASNLGEDKDFLEHQGDYQKMRRKTNKKTNSL